MKSRNRGAVFCRVFLTAITSDKCDVHVGMLPQRLHRYRYLFAILPESILRERYDTDDESQRITLRRGRIKTSFTEISSQRSLGALCADCEIHECHKALFSSRSILKYKIDGVELYRNDRRVSLSLPN